jgi:RimJ/RimL family protein N-acetyltransferase
MAELAFPNPPLADGVVVLRPWAADDLEFVVGAFQDPEMSLYSSSTPYPYKEADAVSWFARREPRRLSGECIDFVVVDAESGAPLGAVNLIEVSAVQQAATVGYWLAREARGGGRMSRAVRLLAGWAFDELGLVRLELLTDPENVASQRVAERCGFRREGRLRSHVRVLHSGERRDSLVYGLLAGELV